MNILVVSNEEELASKKTNKKACASLIFLRAEQAKRTLYIIYKTFGAPLMPCCLAGNEQRSEVVIHGSFW
jgi:hypothetical protein